MLRNRLLQTLCYFDVFQHPLTLEELVNLCDENSLKEEVETSLKALILDEKCYSKDGYYSIQQDLLPLIKIRQEKENTAVDYFKKLPSYAKIIKSFPFVRGIAISGSLSKGVMHEGGDIDYFIITKKDRLWICRTLLVLFKKVFLLNSRKYFCLNYFVDEDNLEIIDKNIFTAVEITHLSTVYNATLLDQLKEDNAWVKSFFPNFSHPLNTNITDRDSKLKRYIEKLLANKLGDRIDLSLMRLTYRRWRNKFSHFPQEKLELTMRSNRGISKHHPRDFQNKVLREFSDRCEKVREEALAQAI